MGEDYKWKLFTEFTVVVISWNFSNLFDKNVNSIKEKPLKLQTCPRLYSIKGVLTLFSSKKGLLALLVDFIIACGDE